MRGSVWTSDVVLGFTILISTICSSCVVICLENEGGPQQPDNISLMTSSNGGVGSINNFDTSPALYLQQQPPYADRYFRNHYELLRDSEPIWKRAPAAGFYGMRGKKVPSSSFYGMRGKKGPSGFLGMRGKKSFDSNLGGTDAGTNLFEGSDRSLQSKVPRSTSPLLSSKLNEVGENVGMGTDSFDDYSLFGASGPSSGLPSPYKRAPSEGFYGVRGRRSMLTLGQPARSYN